MLRWALVFFIIAVVAAFFGYGPVAADAAGIARILFFFFLIACAAMVLFGLISGRRPPLPPV